MRFAGAQVVSAFVGLAIGPVTARAIELLTASKQNGFLPLALLVVAWLVYWHSATSKDIKKDKDRVAISRFLLNACSMLVCGFERYGGWS